jgi:uncharacterized repeat protein (TIGR01451 family)
LPGKGQLVLHMQLDTGLSGALSKDSRSLNFATGDGQALHYSDLRAVDAAGRDLPAGLVYAKGQVAIQVDDHAAAYPITVDPLIYIEDELFSSDGVLGDRFGNSVAISGDTALVGASVHQVGSHAQQGAAYIFLRLGSTWVQQAELTSSDGAYGDVFGESVALSGDNAVIGAWNHNNGQGEAYVFMKPAGGWADATETARLTASDGAASNFFGYSVAISGGTVVIGARFHSNGLGGAYVFVKPGGGWINGTQTAILTASNGATYDYFGRAVAISGDAAVIGADGHSSNRGEAYMFVKPAWGWGNSNETARLTASDGAAGDYFGASVGISGDTTVIGAYANGGKGEAYVFVKPASGWVTGSETTRLTASDGAAGERFGISVAISGDIAFIGAYWHNNNGGAAYVYFPYRSEDLWVNTVSSNLSPRVGQMVTFTATVTNFGSNPSPAVMLSAPLPTGLSLVKSLSSLGTYDPVTGYWNVGSLGVNVTVTLELQSTVTPAAIGTSPVFTAALLGWDPNPNNNSASVAMNPVPYLGRSPSSLDFGQQLLGAAPFQTVTVTNQTLGSITFGSLAAPAGFKIGVGPLHLFDSCSNHTIAALTTCSFNVYFSATSLGVYSGNINIPSTSPISSSASLPVSGTYIAPVSFSPPSLSFPDQTVGTASPLQTVTVTNLSPASVTLGSLSAPAGFQLSMDTCTAATLLPSAACIFSLQFMPASAGAFHGNVTIPMTSPALSVSVPVSGAGLPVLTFGTLGLIFPDTFVQSTSAARTVKITNLTAGIASLGTLVAPPGFLLSSNTCNAKKLAASGGSCTFAVQFKPLSAISYAASITVPIASSSSSMSLPVSGTGLPLLSFSPTGLTFPSQLIHTTSPAQTVTVTNVSPASLTLGTLVAPPGFPISVNTCNVKILASLATCTFAVQVTPSVAGPIASSIFIPVAKPVTSMNLPVNGSGVSGSELLFNTSFETAAAPPVPDG